MGGITVHFEPGVDWQRLRVVQMQRGLERLGFEVTLTQSRKRLNANPAVLFGTTFWKDVESGDWLLVDRACWGDPEYVRLGWNGHGTDADYRWPKNLTPRWIPTREQQAPGQKVIVCGDYGSCPPHEGATHFKPHPADPTNYPGLPIVDSFEDCKYAICGRSTVAVHLKLLGIWVHLTDHRNMAHMALDQIAWTQWSWDEIEQGETGHLFEWLKSRA